MCNIHRFGHKRKLYFRIAMDKSRVVGPYAIDRLQPGLQIFPPYRLLVDLQLRTLALTRVF